MKVSGITCRLCGSDNLKTMDSRPNRIGIRRRKKCLDCGERLTSIEVFCDMLGGDITTMDALRGVIIARARAEMVAAVDAAIAELEAKL